MKNLEGKIVDVYWRGANGDPERHRLIEAQTDIGFVKLGDAAFGMTASCSTGFWGMRTAS